MQSGDMPRRDVGVEWLGQKGSWAFYLFILLTARVLIGALLSLRSFIAWTVVNVGHAAFTFVVFHWLKGMPFVTFWNQSCHELTWWEQLDHREQGTPNRKFCMVVVIALYLITYESTPLDRQHAPVHSLNLIASTVLFIAKLPAMDKVRIFGING
mmetsp:Transcript_9672/g.20403  ORF Transcript_9672/g.20403 Transcript_9672/m.20403 type:complete len:155 (+) Transcript_9672:182-646(+)